MRLFLLFIIVPVIEIALFIEVGGMIGTWPTVGLIVLTAFMGSWLLRRQGLAAMRQVQERLMAGDQPTQLLAEGAMILFAGALLLTPGFFTDATGLALLLPPVRRWLWHRMKDRVAVRTATMRGRTFHVRTGGTVIDGEYTEVEPQEPPVNQPGRPKIDDEPRRD